MKYSYDIHHYKKNCYGCGKNTEKDFSFKEVSIVTYYKTPQFADAYDTTHRKYPLESRFCTTCWDKLVSKVFPKHSCPKCGHFLQDRTKELCTDCEYIKYA
jgi:predicted RNA-binding Zn-ribbon protein involved in translation (DUF1610 family)